MNQLDSNEYIIDIDQINVLQNGLPFQRAYYRERAYFSVFTVILKVVTKQNIRLFSSVRKSFRKHKLSIVSFFNTALLLTTTLSEILMLFQSWLRLETVNRAFGSFSRLFYLIPDNYSSFFKDFVWKFFEWHTSPEGLSSIFYHKVYRMHVVEIFVILKSFFSLG